MLTISSLNGTIFIAYLMALRGVVSVALSSQGDRCGESPHLRLRFRNSILYILLSALDDTRMC